MGDGDQDRPPQPGPPPGPLRAPPGWAHLPTPPSRAGSRLPPLRAGRVERDWSVPGYRAAAPAQPRAATTELLAPVALGLAILSFLVPVVPAVIALLLAGTAASRIRAGRGAIGGSGYVTAARIVAVLGLTVLPLAVLGALKLARHSVQDAATVVRLAPADARAGSPAAARAPGTAVYAGDLQTGDCLDFAPGGPGAGLYVARHGCALPHDAEVVTVLTLPGSVPADDRAIAHAAEPACARGLESYAGGVRPGLRLSLYVPTAAGLERGDRRVVCLASATGRQRASGSLHDRR